MKHHFLKALFACFAVWASTTPSFAQVVSPSVARQLPGLTDRDTLRTALNPAVRSSVTITNGLGFRDTATDVPLTSGSGLSSFMMAFQNGDHALRYIAVAPTGPGVVQVHLGDSRNDDPLNAAASWWTIPGATGDKITINAVTNTQSTVTIPAGPPQHALVLGGFKISIDRGFDHLNTFEQRVQRLSIQLSQPLREPRINEPARARISFDTHDPGEQYQVVIHYAWVPISYLKTIAGSSYTPDLELASNVSRSLPSAPFTGTLSDNGGSERAIANIRGGAPRTDRTILTGFDFSFTNEPHHLLAFGVHLNGQTGRAAPSSEAISWQDNNRDDPINWTVSYFTLK